VCKSCGQLTVAINVDAAFDAVPASPVGGIPDFSLHRQGRLERTSGVKTAALSFPAPAGDCGRGDDIINGAGLRNGYPAQIFERKGKLFTGVNRSILILSFETDKLTGKQLACLTGAGITA